MLVLTERSRRHLQRAHLEPGDEDLEVTVAHAPAEGAHHARHPGGVLLQLHDLLALHPIPVSDSLQAHLSVQERGLKRM